MEGGQDKPQAAPGSVETLEVKDAQVIFTNVWNELEAEFGHENLRFSKELILLGGAPGAGKGTNTEFIMQARDLTCAPIVVSSLLNTPEARRIKQAGGMVGDREVVGLVFRKLLEEEYRDGCLLDGFPRTQVQVECLKRLVLKMNQLYREYHETPLATQFRKPTIHVMVLFVDEKTSIERQLKRGREVAERNARARAEGDVELLEERATDQDPETARRRYRVFKEQTWAALQSLKEVFHYHFINAQGDLESVERNIRRELDYQSSLELDPETFDAVRHLPLASELVTHARQELVKRMDSYELENRQLFHDVIRLIDERFMPIVARHSIPGMAIVNSEDKLLDDPLALAMMIDIFAERGYRAVADVNLAEIPESVDLQTGRITCSTKCIYRFQIRFTGSRIRR
ncbi:MAG: nucleoside monophosphate kinase [Planctomycetota bacterium]|nr:MAG: nucleoside monophosphate kinase [Planctomycetota bacterium]REJ92938.1 MAG: nucleoside monophosphate kinase [Planctomycetota bacterium]REK26132.1 MAG: nucleoside monophosphate kinase [Planctomycetota bacterium]REK33502.1 MAG: nucleoside monophosphate kinase [Planctomycetota bacterium]